MGHQDSSTAGGRWRCQLKTGLDGEKCLRSVIHLLATVKFAQFHCYTVTQWYCPNICSDEFTFSNCFCCLQERWFETSCTWSRRVSKVLICLVHFM